MSAVLQGMAPEQYPVLCVDDEPQILEALALTLGRRFHVTMACGAEDALQKLRETPNTAVIISDMRMPKMSGAEFLAASRSISPNARRILITGYTDIPTAVAAVNEGQIFRFLTKPCESADLVAAVQAAIVDIQEESFERSAIRRFAERQVLDRDPHSGLASRERLLERLTESQARATADGAPADCLFLIDIDNLVQIVDEANLSGSEPILGIFARRLQGHFPDAVCLACYNETTFAGLVAEGGDSEVALQLAGIKLVDALTEPLELDGLVLPVALSVGIAQVLPGTDDARVVLKHAELAAREAKRRGANSVCVFTPESQAKTEYRRELLRALRIAVEKEELALHYQPIVDVEHNRLHAVEALARWQHAQLGNVSPGTFIPLAEESGLMIPFGGWVLRQACTTARSLVGPACPRVSVNVSVPQILDTGFLYSIYLALEGSGLDPEALELELTESVFAGDMDMVCRLLESVRKLGVRIAIDDFGVGYSSLGYLNRLPVNAVKTDISFVRNFHSGGEAIIGATLELAHKLGLEVVIEGVETEEMLRKVRRLGATKVQGYLFGKPMSMAQLTPWLVDFDARHPCLPG
jgi:predicted signal transduction protein with EAL and GGDEF domain